MNKLFDDLQCISSSVFNKILITLAKFCRERQNILELSNNIRFNKEGCRCQPNYKQLFKTIINNYCSLGYLRQTEVKYFYKPLLILAFGLK